ncbi:MAG TPA: flavin reductase family protein [Kofleriaceae bacterium]|nr:flavin reductase family protein [Kofleriaceae bacterium]
MARRAAKRDFPVDQTRRHLEPGPIVLISSAWRGATNIMTLGWHMMLDYAVVGTYIWDANHSFELIRRSKQCVINVPTSDLVDAVIGIGNTRGDRVDKFAAFGLTPVAAARVDAPLVAECYASFECRLADASQIRKRGLFVWDVVAAHVAPTPKQPETLHYRGGGVFMLSGRWIDRRRQFKPQNL